MRGLGWEPWPQEQGLHHIPESRESTQRGWGLGAGVLSRESAKSALQDDNHFRGRPRAAWLCQVHPTSLLPSPSQVSGWNPCSFYALPDVFFKWCLLSPWHPARGWVAIRHPSGETDKGQKRHRWGQGPELTRTLRAGGKLSAGGEHETHTDRPQRSLQPLPSALPGLAGKPQGPLCAKGPAASRNELRTPWGESRRKVEWDPLASQVIRGGVEWVQPQGERVREDRQVQGPGGGP